VLLAKEPALLEELIAPPADDVPILLMLLDDTAAILLMLLDDTAATLLMLLDDIVTTPPPLLLLDETGTSS